MHHRGKRTFLCFLLIVSDYAFLPVRTMILSHISCSEASTLRQLVHALWPQATYILKLANMNSEQALRESKSKALSRGTPEVRECFACWPPGDAAVVEGPIIKD